MSDTNAAQEHLDAALQRRSRDDSDGAFLCLWRAVNVIEARPTPTPEPVEGNAKLPGNSAANASAEDGLARAFLAAEHAGKINLPRRYAYARVAAAALPGLGWQPPASDTAPAWAALRADVTP